MKKRLNPDAPDLRIFRIFAIFNQQGETHSTIGEKQ
jgi:hypothetical protein